MSTAEIICGREYRTTYPERGIPDGHPARICDECGGLGHVEAQIPVLPTDDSPRYRRADCDPCAGSGEIFEDECNDCGHVLDFEEGVGALVEVLAPPSGDYSLRRVWFYVLCGPCAHRDLFND